MKINHKTVRLWPFSIHLRINMFGLESEKRLHTNCSQNCRHQSEKSQFKHQILQQAGRKCLVAKKLIYHQMFYFGLRDCTAVRNTLRIYGVRLSSRRHAGKYPSGRFRAGSLGCGQTRS